MSIQCETITVKRAEQLTGLPRFLIEALARSGRIPAEEGENSQLYVGKAALLGWCKLYARILEHSARRESAMQPILAGCSVFELVWMSRNGLLQRQEGSRARA